MINFIYCYDANYKLIGEYKAPFDMEIDCHVVRVYGNDLSGMKLRGKCERLNFQFIVSYKEVDLSGFMELEIGKMLLGAREDGLLKLLELNCKLIKCYDEKLRNIMNKYLSEPDPLMRDFEGFKLEMAVNGYGDKL